MKTDFSICRCALSTRVEYYVPRIFSGWCSKVGDEIKVDEHFAKVKMENGVFEKKIEKCFGGRVRSNFRCVKVTNH